jgi:hypothetical protein
VNAELLRPQHHPISFDHTRRFEPLQTPSDLRRRERHLLAQLLMRGAPKALQHVEQGEVEMIEFEHEADMRVSRGECDFIALARVRSQTPRAKGPFHACLTNCFQRQTE